MGQIESRLSKLEQQAAGASQEELVFFVTIYGRNVPRACQRALLERNRQENPGQNFRVVFLFDDDCRCRACGEEHLAEGAASEV